jgi:hypothetical protein
MNKKIDFNDPETIRKTAEEDPMELSSMSGGICSHVDYTIHSFSILR